MTSRDFCYWLQGYLELRDPKGAGEVCGPMNLSPDQVARVKRHLALVFVHEIDPSAGNQKHQEQLNEVHNGKVWDQGERATTAGGLRPDLRIRC